MCGTAPRPPGSLADSRQESVSSNAVGCGWDEARRSVKQAPELEQHGHEHGQARNRRSVAQDASGDGTHHDGAKHDGREQAILEAALQRVHGGRRGGPGGECYPPQGGDVASRAALTWREPPEHEKCRSGSEGAEQVVAKQVQEGTRLMGYPEWQEDQVGRRPALGYEVQCAVKSPGQRRAHSSHDGCLARRSWDQCHHEGQREECCRLLGCSAERQEDASERGDGRAVRGALNRGRGGEQK